MPGRGRFWGVGDLNDEIVEEADLTQAVQTKLNAVGGGGGDQHLEKLADVTSSGSAVEFTGSFTAVNIADYSHFEAIVYGDGNGGGDNWKWRVNGLSAGYSDTGASAADGWDAGSISGSGPLFSKLTIAGLGKFNGSGGGLETFSYIDSSIGSTVTSLRVAGRIADAFTTLSSVTIRSNTEFLEDGARLVIWGYKLTAV